MYARLTSKKTLATLAGLATGTVAVGTGLYYYNRERPGALQAATTPANWLKNLPTREEQIDALSQKDVEYDILIIGGGATGAGVAVDAAVRGLKTAMVEKFDFSSGTSSRSTKLIHGGVRYLQKAIQQLDIEQVGQLI